MAIEIPKHDDDDDENKMMNHICRCGVAKQN